MGIMEKLVERFSTFVLLLSVAEFTLSDASAQLCSHSVGHSNRWKACPVIGESSLDRSADDLGIPNALRHNLCGSKKSSFPLPNRAAELQARVSLYEKSATAIHAMHAAVFNFNKMLGPRPHCNPASCENPDYCNQVLPACKVAVIHNNKLHTFPTCSDKVEKALHCNRIAIDCNVVKHECCDMKSILDEAGGDGEDDKLIALSVDLAAGWHDGLTGEQQPAGSNQPQMFWSEQTVQGHLPAYNENMKLTNSSMSKSFRPALCMGSQMAFKTTDDQMPNHQCQSKCPGQLNSCDINSGGMFSCSKFCVRMLRMQQPKGSDAPGCKPNAKMFQFQSAAAYTPGMDASANDASSTNDYVWLAIVTKNTVCTQLCHNRTGHAVQCTADSRPVWNCNSKKTATFYNCVTKCYGFADVCNHAKSKMKSAAQGTNTVAANRDFDVKCMQIIGECLKEGLCETITQDSYARTKAETCPPVSAKYKEFSQMIAME